MKKLYTDGRQCANNPAPFITQVSPEVSTCSTNKDLPITSQALANACTTSPLSQFNLSRKDCSHVRGSTTNVCTCVLNGDTTSTVAYIIIV